MFTPVQLIAVWKTCLVKARHNLSSGESLLFSDFSLLLLRPKLKISLFPLTRPTLSKLADWNLFIGNLPSLFFFFFVSLKIRYAENSVFWIRFAKRSIFSHYRAHLCRKKKAYLPIHFQNCGSGKGKQKYV